MKRIKNYHQYRAWLAALAASALLVACSDSRDPVLGSGAIAGLVPTVTAVAPMPGAANVPINATVITAAFSEPVSPITGSASFTVTCAAPCVSPVGIVTLDSTNRIATFALAPATPLAPLTEYTATVTAAKSLASGVSMARPYVWKFTTGATGDAIRPSVTITVPADAEPAAPANAAVTAVFSEDMFVTTVTTAGRFALSCALPCVSPTGVVTYSVATRKATFTPSAPLEESTLYTATILSTVTDLAGNQLGGNQAPLPAASNYVWTFTTGAALPPANVTVQTTKPAADAVAVCPTRTIAATFNIPSGLHMDDSTITATNFTVTGPGPLFTPVLAQTVAIDIDTGTIATFTPADPLTDGVTYTATIKGGATGVKDLAIPANTMLADYSWSFTAGPPTGVCQPAVQMGLISTFGIAATAGITNTPTVPVTVINGDVVLDPTATCNFVAIDAAGGFGLCGSNASTPTINNGTVISPLYPDAGVTSGAVKASLLATYLSITPPAGPPAAGSLGGATAIAAGTTLGEPTGAALVEGDNLFYPGVYQSVTSILITGDLTLDAMGDPEAVFIFQSSSTVGAAAGAIGPGPHTRILLVNGAKASNVWFQAGTSATLGTYAEFQGNILAGASITMETGATSCGRLLAGAFTAGAFVFDSNVVSVPGNGCPE